MKLNTVIFDMDGLIIDSEPLWYEASVEIMGNIGIVLTEDEYAATVGLRTRECLDFWFRLHNLDLSKAPVTEKEITSLVISKIKSRGQIMPGVENVIEFFRSRDFRTGLATSSAMPLVDAVMERTGLRNAFTVLSSAEHLTFGKPHPQVYLNCASELQSLPIQCVCFEDSFNGMIAAKAARMKCVVVPAPEVRHEPKWNAADSILHSLEEFNEDILKKIDR